MIWLFLRSWIKLKLKHFLKIQKINQWPSLSHSLFSYLFYLIIWAWWFSKMPKDNNILSCFPFIDPISINILKIKTYRWKWVSKLTKRIRSLLFLKTNLQNMSSSKFVELRKVPLLIKKSSYINKDRDRRIKKLTQVNRELIEKLKQQN